MRNDGRTLSIGGAITNTEAPYDIVRKMRASVLVLGPLLARVGEARVSLPGGCAIGTRPIDLHLKGLEQLGATSISTAATSTRASRPAARRHDRVAVRLGRRDRATADGGDRWPTARPCWPTPRASRRSPTWRLPRAHGRADQGIGTDKLVIEGVARLHGATHTIIPDRIETGSYACAAAISGGDGASCATRRLEHLGAAVRTLREAGRGDRRAGRTALMVKRLNGLHGADAMTEPYPGFPTDMQAQFMALMSVAEGASMVTETIFENRFMHVPELNRMGARINVHGASAIVRGVPSLKGAPVMATDLRASLSLVLAGLAAQGETMVNRVYHLDRGYEAVERKLAACGADIERIAG